MLEAEQYLKSRDSRPWRALWSDLIDIKDQGVSHELFVSERAPRRSTES